MIVKNIALSLATVLLLACEADVQKSKDNSEELTSLQAADTSKATRLASVEQDVEEVLTQLTLQEKISLIHASGKFHVNAIDRVGIKEMWLSDGPHGVRHQIQRDSWSSAGWTDDHATYLPHLTSVAASWDRNIAALHGNVLGSEARHREKDLILGPGVNLARLPLYGRNFEYMGEDPMLAAKLVVPQIKAIQQHDVAATIKHYALNTQELNRIGVNAKPDERTLREVYLPAFEYAVKEANVYSFMGAYNEYYGTNANQSKHLVMDILKGEWGFNGVLLTDWNVDINTFDAAMNGLDLEMGTDVDSYDDYFLAKPLEKMIESGKVPMAVLDDKVRRVLRLQFSIGMYDENRAEGERNTESHQNAALKIAEEGVILLKNDLNVLPLEKSTLKNVLVLGPNANKKHGQGGGSSEVKSLYEITPLAGLQAALGENVNIQVMRAKSSSLSPIASDYVASRHWTGTPAWNISSFEDINREKLISESWIVDSKFDAKSSAKQYITMKAKIKPLKTGTHNLKIAAQGQFSLLIDGKEVIQLNGVNDKVTEQAIQLTAKQEYQFEINYDGQNNFTLGWDAPGDLFTDESEYLAAAKAADAVIYFGGLSHADDRESIDRLDMKLPGNQDEVISKLLAANENTVVFLVAGSAVEMPWVEQASTIVWGWYGGMEAGNAFMNVLTGVVNPSGKLPITLPVKLADTAPIALQDYNEKESLYSEGVFIGYRWFEQQNIKPLFPFGHGISYSSFEYSDIKLSNETINSTDVLTVTATVKNTSTTAGAEIVQLYLSDKEASVARPAKELKDFAKVFLKPGEAKTVTMELVNRDLAFWDVETNDWLVEQGEFEVLVGASVADVRLRKSFQYQQ
ncbi:glycoside hydrolase family 3 C-terminal domain-containing protein [Thalassotalea nanhaiensis]|uniref:Glycoside hydrolase family 3 C-terminal domain-containing protein n=1 Tax=Thalassotalea nanhaiensis TaxID=3065648 RepID=A0ABY9TGG1_9GAMM|nr:glycoside hydrolase family 3 C-terminal domain-containing protein [Colwelliaceae bacterium SQ345]